MKVFSRLATVACLAALSSVLSPDTASAQTKELRYSLYLPPRSVEGGVVPPFLEELSKRTNGRVTGRLFPGGQLFSGPATLKGIRDGGADMGFIVLPLTLGELAQHTMDHRTCCGRIGSSSRILPNLMLG